ncbi:MaoC/PaaZ C-terminal domain-containing protein [uncultured Serinicoccus sp.]|uniref:MaoC/PaaZ C-terminal domain-containing protein n=1 Tax=uncultured Serinicoccus sp. TaxID=735514 RepID=UPI002613A3FD|nr:MaoC/PaaZ C-terminal domain-containing protein [uncultured Serinicoccus sp.]
MSRVDVDVELLDRTPRVATSFATGVATGPGRPGARGELPARRLVLPGVRQDLPRLAGFCEVTGGLLADTVPATWLHVLTFPLQVRLMSARDFPFPMLGMVHVGNRMRVHRPVRVSEELTLSTWAELLAPHRKGSTVDLVGEVRVADELVWEGRSTYLVRGDTPPGATAEEVPTEVGAAARAAGPGRQVALWRLPADLGRSYARVAGDANPIHLSKLSAKAFGFPRAIAHGMWTHARALAAVQPRLPQRYAVSATFVKPILLPSTVVLRTGGPGLDDLSVTDREGSRMHLSMQVDGPL